MKKILLILSLLIISLFVKAQEPSVIETYKNRIAIYNSYTDEYDFQDYSYATLTFKMYDTYISVDDKQHSVYRAIERLPDTKTKNYQAVTIKCLDEKNRECNFGLMKFNDGEMRIIIVYPKDLLIVYNIN